jgi:hypothetical protein
MKSPVLLFLVLLPIYLSAQSVKITKLEALDVIDHLEPHPVEIIEVKTLKKWKAFGLSSDMKPQMNYNVVKVTYKTRDSLKIVIIDMHLVPIRYDFRKNEAFYADY